MNNPILPNICRRSFKILINKKCISIQLYLNNENEALMKK